jgi:polyhydroxyalkanoate synthesis regulator phasin
VCGSFSGVSYRLVDVLDISGIQEEIDNLENRIHQLEEKVEDLENA